MSTADSGARSATCPDAVLAPWLNVVRVQDRRPNDFFTYIATTDEVTGGGSGDVCARMG